MQTNQRADAACLPAYRRQGWRLIECDCHPMGECKVERKAAEALIAETLR
jgi:hypothetical protein